MSRQSPSLPNLPNPRKTPQKSYDKIKVGIEATQEAAIKKYTEKYPELSVNHVDKIAKVTDHYLLSCFDPKYEKTDKEKRFSAGFAKHIQKDIDLELRKKADPNLLTLYFLQRQPDTVKFLFKKEGLPEVENPEEYIPLIKEVTQERSPLIVNTLKNAGLIKERSRKPKIQGTAKENIPPSRKRSASPEENEDRAGKAEEELNANRAKRPRPLRQINRSNSNSPSSEYSWPSSSPSSMGEEKSRKLSPSPDPSEPKAEGLFDNKTAEANRTK